MHKAKTFDRAELDRIAETIKRTSASGRPRKLEHPMSSMVGAPARANAGLALADALTRAGVDVTAIAGKATTLEPMPGARADSLGGPTGDPTAERRAYKRANMAQLEALNQLARPDLILVMNEPFLIWEYPNPEIGVFVDSEILPMDSFVRVFISDSRSYGSREFVFYYIWQNPDPAPASVVFATSLVFNGKCSVTGAPGIFSGTAVDLYVYPFLEITRWSGWGTDPNTGDGTAVTGPAGVTGGGVAVSLHAQGGHIFQGPRSASQSLSFLPIDCGYRNLLVPGNAVTLLTAVCVISYVFDGGGGNLSDNVTVDFSNSGGFIGCPSMIVLATPA